MPPVIFKQNDKVVFNGEIVVNESTLIVQVNKMNNTITCITWMHIKYANIFATDIRDNKPGKVYFHRNLYIMKLYK